jgi:alpha-tubulin suppressor-like RCC1 family protein/subtilisin family serine protease
MLPSQITPRGLFAFAVFAFLALTLVAGWATNLTHASRAWVQNRGLTTVRDKTRTSEIMPGEILVRFRNDAKAARATTKAGAYSEFVVDDNGRTIPIQVESLNPGPEIVEGLRVARVDSRETLKAIEALRARPDVIYAEPNLVRRRAVAPNDARYSEMWNLKNTGQGGGSAGRDIKAEQAWDITTGSRSIVVGVVDEGIDINHPDLKDNIWTNPAEVAGNSIDDDGNGLIDDINGWDFVHDDNSVFDGNGTFPADETDAHGTHVAGTIGAVGNNSIGVAGLNWQVSLISLKFLGPGGEGTTVDLLQALSYAKAMRDLWVSSGGAKGANIQILNNSYTGARSSQAERDAVRALGDSGILFVAAAGNESRGNERDPVFPANYNEPNVISVSSTNRFDSLSFFSNYGATTVHMAAPGQEILSTTPNGTYEFSSGTSMASPHVAGAAALLRAANPSLSLSRLRASLLFGGDQLSPLTPPGTPFSETGLITGRRLNAAGSLSAASEADATPPAALDTFHVTSQQGRRLNVSWSATGDDGIAGRASLYEIRYTETDPRLSTPADFQRGYVFSAPLPGVPGAVHSLIVDVPWRQTSGFVGIRALDNVGNASPIAVVPFNLNQNDADPYIQSLTATEALSTGGTALGLVGDDLYTTSPYQLPFDFTFFGASGRGLYVSTNGALYFTDPPQIGNPSTLDDSTNSIERLKSYRMIAGLWDDLRTDHRLNGDVYVVKPDPTRVIFRWQAVTFDLPTGTGSTRGEHPVNFEIELRRDGTIIKRYGDGNTNVFPVVGISGGDPDAYLVPSHTSEFSLVNLTNAQTVVYTPRKPTPLPTPDMAVGLRAAPEPAASGELLTYQIDATNTSASSGAGEQTRVTTQIPAGTSLVLVTASSQQGATVSAPPAGSTSGNITIDFGSIFFGTSGTATIIVNVIAPAGSTVTNTASITNFWQDPNLANNSATTQTTVITALPFNDVKAISAGGMAGSDGQTVVLKNDGTVWSWGSGLFGQLGDGTTSFSTTPVLVQNISGVTAVSAGGLHTLALKSDGTVWGWGNNQSGQMGFQGQFTFSQTIPVQIPNLSSIVAISAGQNHSLALKTDGTVWAWGANNWGQIGNGTNSQVYTPVQVSGLTNVKAIDAGREKSIALKNDGSVWGWGSNQSQVLRLPSFALSSNVPVQIADVADIAALTLGDFHVIALKQDGTLISWGSNDWGQLGDNNGAPGSLPRVVVGLTNVSKLAAGGDHTLAIRNDGSVWSWGRNTLGALGDGTTNMRPAPVPVNLGATAIAIAAGFQHSAAVLSDGTVRTWGANSSGQLGDRTRLDRSFPVQVHGPLATAMPTFSPDGGSFTSARGVFIQCATPGAIIHYTTNGNDPTENDTVVGSGETLILNTTTTLKARAYKSGWQASAVKAAVFTFPAPTVEFESATYSTAENVSFIQLKVTRSGNTAVPSTVKYSTSDATDVNFVCNPATAGQITGAASRKCDYHIASGRVRFAAGETSKLITLSVVNDVYVEPSETLSIALSYPTGSALGTINTATVTITDDDTVGQPNPIDNTGFFVTMLYVDLLSRQPEPAGLAGWIHRIDFCGQPGEPPPPCDRVTVGGDGFLRSAEFFDRQLFVIRLYRAGLGRILTYNDVGDLAFVSGFLSSSELELNKNELVAEIMSRPEFGNRYNPLSNIAYVDKLIQTAGVPPEFGFGLRDSWIWSLDSGTKSRAQVFRELSERPEVSAKYLREAQVASCYYGFFTRNPDAAYFDFLGRLDRGEINLGDLANAFINAAEYRQRFGP